MKSNIDEHLESKVARISQQRHIHLVRMAELMREVASLPKRHQDQLAAFLMHLRLQQDPAWRNEMTRRIDEDSPANWVSLQTWKRELKARK